MCECVFRTAANQEPYCKMSNNPIGQQPVDSQSGAVLHEFQPRRHLIGCRLFASQSLTLCVPHLARPTTARCARSSATAREQRSCRPGKRCCLITRSSSHLRSSFRCVSRRCSCRRRRCFVSRRSLFIFCYPSSRIV